MTVFEFVAVTISLILGLGIANLLSSAVELVRRRDKVRFHWIAIFWAMIILWIHLEFWWSLFAIQQRTQWSHGEFLLVASFVTALFASGSLVLPRGDDETTVDLADYFTSNGKWGVGLFGIVHLLAFPLNYRLFGVPYTAPMNLLLVTMLLTILGTVLSKSMRVATLLAVVAMAIQLAILSITVVPALGE